MTRPPPPLPLEVRNPAAWEALHQQPRHRLRHPSEHVVRFLSSLGWPSYGAALDIGCGSGRHTELLDNGGWGTFAVDASQEACAATRLRVPGAVVERASAQDLPFRAGAFAVALAFGVFYYGTLEDGERAVAELHRVLRPGGKALVCARSARDWRAAQDAEGYIVQRAVHAPGEPEDGMTMHFLTGADIDYVYRAFSDVTYELTETTTRGRTRCDSDWLISVTK